MKTELRKIFNHYKKIYKLKTKLIFSDELDYCYFRGIKNIIFMNLYLPEVEKIEQGFNIMDTTIGSFKNLLKTKREGYIWILLHEIKHAIDYTCYFFKWQTEMNKCDFNMYPNNREYYKTCSFEKRADRFAKKEIIKWIK